jgi:hypothetical protein
MTQALLREEFSADLEIVKDGGGGTAGIALASLRRERTAEHEEMWVQLFVDGVFEDVKRALYVDEKTSGAFFVRFGIPLVYRDGTSHRAQVRFVRAVSRIVPRGTGDRFGSSMIQTPEAVAESDFSA